MPPWRTAQMVLPAPRGTVPMIRLRGRSLDVMVAGTLASRLHGAPCRRPKPATAGRDGRIGNDAALSMSYVQARTQAPLPSTAIRSARMPQAQQSSANGALLG